jgi:hypothetical protein
MMSDALFEPARYDKAPALFDAELAPHPHIVDAQTTARVRWDMSARPGDVVRVTTDGRGGYQPTEYVGVLIDNPACTMPRVRESGRWGECDHANTWATLDVIERTARRSNR